MNMTTNKVLFHIYIMNFVFRHIYHLAYQSELPKELTKIRISCHDLLIECERYFRSKIPQKERECNTCQIEEDEEHFMLFVLIFMI